MATATCRLSEDQFQCTVCCEVFTDPVTLPCGHNFCKSCIEQSWSKTPTFNCPCCYMVFNHRPVLRVNPFIAEMAVQFNRSKAHSTTFKQEAKPGEILCDICTDPKLKALKSCLVCLASYCDTHLQPHQTVSGLNRHQLIEPVENLEERVCKEHNKLLELFCKNNRRCVCVICTYSDHKGHEIVPLVKATEEQKCQLKKTEDKIEEKICIGEKKIQELQRCMEESNTNADREIAESVKVFTALSELVEKCSNNLIQTLTRKNQDIQEKAKWYIKELEREISNLKNRSTEVKQFLQSDDHLHFLQNFQQINSSPYIKDWDNIHLAPPTYKGTVVKALSQLEEDFIKTTKNLFEAELERAKTHDIEVMLDSDTAHLQRSASRNQKDVAQITEKRVVHDNTKKFNRHLGKQSFSETFYFEAEVKKKNEWTLGVAKATFDRKGPITSLHSRNRLLAIGLRNKMYHAFDSTETFLSTRCKPDKVGVFVDYEEGLVSFYDTEAVALIHSFSDDLFSRNLSPFYSSGAPSRPTSFRAKVRFPKTNTPGDLV